VDLSEEDVHALLTHMTGLKLALELLQTREPLSGRQARLLGHALQAENGLERTLVGRVAEGLGWGAEGDRIAVERRRSPRRSEPD
jgi:hypothetical protein